MLSHLHNTSNPSSCPQYSKLSTKWIRNLIEHQFHPHGHHHWLNRSEQQSLQHPQLRNTIQYSRP